MRPRVGSYYEIDLEYLGITETVDIAIGQCINREYGGYVGETYIMLVNYLCNDTYYKERFYINYAERECILKIVTEEEVMQFTRNRKLNSLGIS